MLQTIGEWILASKKAIAGAVVVFVIGVLKSRNIEVVPENFGWLQEALEALVAGAVVWFTRNQVGAVSRKR